MKDKLREIREKQGKRHLFIETAVAEDEAWLIGEVDRLRQHLYQIGQVGLPKCPR